MTIFFRNVEMKPKNNIILKRGFTKVFVSQGVKIINENVESSEIVREFFKVQIRIQYLEFVITMPSIDLSGNLIAGTGGRSDIIFGIHHDDISRFNKRIKYIPRIKSLDEIALSPMKSIYPERLSGYCSWNLKDLSLLTA